MLLDPTVREFLKSLPRHPGGPRSVEAMRFEQSAMQAIPAHRPRAHVESHVLPVGPTGGVAVELVRPTGAAGDLPAVLYFHGGGWTLGNPETHDRLVREVAVGAGAVVLFVDYARSPEARYPTAVEQAYAATRWAGEHGRDLGIDPARLAVAGESSGGNLATVVAMLAKRRGGPPLAAQLMFYPATDAGFDTPSYKEFADGPFLARDLMRWFWDQYAPDVSDRLEPTASPLRAALDDLAGLPPALVITAEHDVLRDEGEAYADRLARAGVAVTATRYLGTIHEFVLLNALADTPAARAALAQAQAFLHDRLSRTGAADPVKYSGAGARRPVTGP
jgi:acetyl esterase